MCWSHTEWRGRRFLLKLIISDIARASFSQKTWYIVGNKRQVNFLYPMDAPPLAKTWYLVRPGRLCR